jgi:hypothetical protein
LRPLFTRFEQRAVRWRVTRAAGPGPLALGEAFVLRTAAGELELSTLRGRLAITFAGARAGAASWSLGCHFQPGPFSEPWSDAARFEVAAGPHASRVARAVSWLQANTTTVRMPAGDLPLVVWDDPTLDPPTVGYLITDTLWAAKALQPYDPDLSDSMQQALIAAGWYGNGLNETLFHGVDAIAHRAASSDWVHGTLLDRCSAVGTPSKAVSLHVPEMTPDPAWTTGNSAQFVDSAIYTTLDAFWHGEVEAARARLREMLSDGRAAAGSDSMFWDLERWVMVDQASRCDYDSNVGTCSPQCPSCGQCQGVFCNQYNAAFKLGLLLYAGRVTGVAAEPRFARTFEQIEYRLWESQLADGGLAHVTIYGPDTTALLTSGATGEATAIAVLAESVVPPEL